MATREPVAEVSVVSANAAETKRFGRCLGKLLKPGDLVLLSGPFGAGKTTITKGIATGLGVREQVTSPSFTLVNQYRISKRRLGPMLNHVDLYRLTSPEEALGLGLEEYITDNAICVIEWPDQAVAILPNERLEVEMAFRGNAGRVLKLVGAGDRASEIVGDFSARCAPRALAEGR